MCLRSYAPTVDGSEAAARARVAFVNAAFVDTSVKLKLARRRMLGAE
jgi:hypothetical protein